MPEFSKWIKIQVSLTQEELDELTEGLFVFPAGRVVKPGDRELPLFWSVTESAIERVHVGDRELIRPTEPVILVKQGLEICYPQYFQVGNEIRKVDDSYPNTALFKRIRRWVRHHVDKERRGPCVSK